MITIKKREDFLLTIIEADVLDKTIEWINDNLAPEDVFSDMPLDEWAAENGYVKSDD